MSWVAYIIMPEHLKYCTQLTACLLNKSAYPNIVLVGEDFWEILTVILVAEEILLHSFNRDLTSKKQHNTY